MTNDIDTRDNRRTAFTLTELLTVIAIIGVLVALLLPAVQSARESARRSSCLNNIKQASLGLIGYQSAKGRFPPAVVCRSSTGGTCDLVGWWNGSFSARSVDWGESWTARILPFIEQASIYNRFNFDLPNNAAVNRSAATVDLPSLRCPSRTADTKFSYSGSNVAKIHYGGNFGAGRAISVWSGTNSALLGVFDGYRQWAASLGQITDGTSKTLLLAEIITAPNSGDSRGAWNVQGSTAFCGGVPVAAPTAAMILSGTMMRTVNPDTTAGNSTVNRDGAIWSPNSPSPGNNEPDPMLWSGDSSSGQAARSRHPGGANVAMADGSARFVTESIDILTWYRLHTIQGGETVGDY
jgi:prepilin-type processing-associated H-X9-DG protein/prepilin-type N-terminal cleavage/methylation domain-containing protein